ncbi:ephrin type-A receptor 4-A isoform X1 [Hetaerina americana]|uniref:ephrin type-A receptor 4-A isoform X1 n=1 Tax=Hetaerina americana TaxID=62018 RepID=UPI003A7F2A61
MPLFPSVVAAVAAALLSLCAGDQVVLLDTTTESSLDWTRYPYGPQANTPGWVEESFTDFEKGINWRSYVVCDVAYNNVNNWLWTPFVERGPANRIYIEVRFTIRDCSLFPGNALSCKETFSLLYYEFDVATREPPPWEPESYKLIGRIAAGEGGRFNTNSDQGVINTEVKSIPVTKKGVYFAFRDQGACISLLAIKMYYITCPEVTVNFTRFPTTPTGREVTIIEQASGECVENAERDGDGGAPTYLCKGDGKWYLLTGGCRCKPGFEADVDKQSCNICPPGKYKNNPGSDDRCLPCPDKSKAPDFGYSECRCDVGYYRAPTDPKSMPCTQPPSAPQNLTVNFVDQSTVILSWSPPGYLGGRMDTAYRVVCDACGHSVSYVPHTERFNETKVTIGGLNPVTTYRFQVFAENGVSGSAIEAEGGLSGGRGGGGKYVDVTVTTEASAISSPSTGVVNVRITSVKSTEVTVAWDPPPPPSPPSLAPPGSSLAPFPLGKDEEGNDINQVEIYEVRCFAREPITLDNGIIGGTGNSTSILTKGLEATFTGLRQRTEHGFQVRAKTLGGWGEYSTPIFKMTGQVLGTAYVGDEDNMQVQIIAVATVAVVVLVVVIIVMTVIFLRSRGTDDCNKKQPSDCDTLEYRNGEGLVVTYMTTPLFTQVSGGGAAAGGAGVSTLGGVAGAGVVVGGGGVVGGAGGQPSVPPAPTSTSSRTYVDPHTYEDPNQAVREFAREIDASCITIEAIIGGGEFGDVCRGKLRWQPPHGGDDESSVTTTDAAIKTLKPGSSEKARIDFLTEASIMGQFEHPNVIFLQGVVTKSNPVMIITEYMENGSLDTFLRANDGKFQVLQLVGMLRGIASGMQYLSEMNYVHRDLAARNVLVNARLVCKIADFGLSREIESTTEGAYTTRGGKIPVRWTAPEAIAFRKFTSASDVWSMGIVCWEVMSYGERPYWNWSNQDVIKSIEKGYRLPAPMDCPEAIYQLMLDCWQKERTHRPTFASIVKTLDKLIRCPDTLRKIAQNRAANPLAPDAPDMTQFASVSEWLGSLKMGRYAEGFERGGVTTMDAVVQLTVKELTALGVTLVGHQKKIMNSVQAMRAQISANLSEGFLV